MMKGVRSLGVVGASTSHTPRGCHPGLVAAQTLRGWSTDPKAEPLCPAPQTFPANTLVSGPGMDHAVPWGGLGGQVRGPARKPQSQDSGQDIQLGVPGPHPAAPTQTGRDRVLAVNDTVAGVALTLSTQPFSSLAATLGAGS